MGRGAPSRADTSAPLLLLSIAEENLSELAPRPKVKASPKKTKKSTRQTNKAQYVASDEEDDDGAWGGDEGKVPDEDYGVGGSGVHASDPAAHISGTPGEGVEEAEGEDVKPAQEEVKPELESEDVKVSAGRALVILVPR